MRWRLILEEYGPDLIYIPGNKNIVADALSRLELVTNKEPIKAEVQALSQHFALKKKDVSEEAYPTNYKKIMLNQQEDMIKIIVLSNFMGQEINILLSASITKQ